MPIIAYQSFNSNASTTHSLGSATAQHFTKLANTHATGLGQMVDVAPYATDTLGEPVQGPVHRRPVGVHDDNNFRTAQPLGGHVATLWQNVYRAMGAMPDIMVCGEIDASHPELSSFVSGSDFSLVPFSDVMHCQSFTAIVPSANSGMLKFLGQGTGWVAYAVGRVVTLFVHVPNSFCNDASDLADWYSDINQRILREQQLRIDMVIGDTNQSTLGRTSSALGAKTCSFFANAMNGSSFVPFDGAGATFGGTNSTQSQMFDVAVYNEQFVRVEKGPIYLSPSGTGLTVTDHCGLAVKVAWG
ncbi:MAG: hypothetical protein JY451_10580 [Erythrobacter sp.]|nr:MAG: hypothetical protein JY451_10580 [Erythrobacter sp.]